MALRKLLFAGGITTVGVGAFVVTRPRPAPFVFDIPKPEMCAAGVDWFPVAHFAFANMPDSMRKYLITKEHAPDGEVPDRFDCTGGNPYTITELVNGRLWRVRYEVVETSIVIQKEREKLKGFGFDPSDEKYRAKILAAARESGGEEVVRVAEKDLEKLLKWSKEEEIPPERMFDVPPRPINSFVVKLKDDSLLLYAPVKVRDEHGFSKWLDSIGNVEWIVIPSGYHTLYLPTVLKRFPHAKCIGPKQAEAKLKHIKALPRGKLDFDSTNSSDLALANRALNSLGVKLFNVEGDVITNALVAVLDDTDLLECDLIYAHPDGVGWSFVDKEQFFQYNPEDWTFRLMKFYLLTKPNSPNGFSPMHRLQMLDPNSLGVFCYDQPALDGSTCVKMAESLRRLLSLKFVRTHGVHYNVMDRQDFRKAIDLTWNWLDAKPLV